MDLLSVGRVSGTHHLKGAIKVTSNLDDLEPLNGSKVMVELPSGDVKILTVKKASNMVDKKWILEFEELTNKTDANSIQNGVIKVRRDILGIEEDEFLANDVLGMKAITEDGENIGEVVDVYETAAHDIYVIEDDEYETMIPDVEVFIKKIDFEKREILVSLIDGMREKRKTKEKVVRINILTLFPEFFDSFKEHSIVKRAVEKEQVEINIVNIRDFAEGKQRQCDDMPFGGGAGMVMKPEPLLKALEQNGGKVIYTSPQGVRLNQKLACDLAQEKEITIIAGHYEGIDERVIDSKVDLEISLGDFVLTGGELPAMVISDSIIRLIPGVIKKESYENDSFYNGLLDYPHYTRPAEYEGLKVPDVLMSGHHKNIDEWRLKQSLKRTLERRPELLKDREFSKLEIKLLKEIKGSKKNDI